MIWNKVEIEICEELMEDRRILYLLQQGSCASIAQCEPIAIDKVSFECATN